VIKILNLYAGIGGNRKLWGGDIMVTAVENNPQIAAIYKDFFPQDNVIVADAHQYLLEHYKEFDFIWSSPPCPTHSGTNNFLNAQGVIRYPDMSLYQEIIFLQKFFKGKYCVENVIPYYEPLIKPQISERHCFWTNFKIEHKRKDLSVTITNSRASTGRTKEQYIQMLQKYHGFDLSNLKVSDTTKIVMLSNCVRPELGKQIFDYAFKNKQIQLTEVSSLSSQG